MSCQNWRFQLFTLFLVFSLIFSSTTIAAEVFRWKDSNGVVHYGEKRNAPAESKKVIINEPSVVNVPSIKEETAAATDANSNQSVGDNAAKCASYARAMVDKQGKSEWVANSKMIQATCPGMGFECTTYNHHPEKNSCVPFAWDGNGTFFKDTKRDFPMNSRF
jgi:hypothetical protein